MPKQILAFLFALPFILAGCNESSDDEQTKTLVMVTSADFPPFEYFDTSSGDVKIVGFDVDVAYRIADYLGYKLEIHDIDFSSVIPTLQSKRADFAMAGITPSEERLKKMDFSTPYYFMNNVMVYRFDNDFMRRNQYENIKVAVLLGSTQEQFAKAWAENHKGVSIMPMNRVGDAIQEVISGRVDGLILDKTPAEAFLQKHPQDLQSTPVQGDTFGAAIAFPKGSPLVKDFDRALKHLQEVGVLDEIVQKWLMNG